MFLKQGSESLNDWLTGLKAVGMFRIFIVRRNCNDDPSRKPVYNRYIKLNAEVYHNDILIE